MSDLDRAQKAKAVLEASAFKDAFEATRSRLIDGLIACKMEDTKNAEEFRLCLKLLDSVKLNLETAVNSGKIDAFRLEEKEKRSKNPLRNYFR